jgi:hypothetical protein
MEQQKIETYQSVRPTTETTESLEAKMCASNVDVVFTKAIHGQPGGDLRVHFYV